MRWQVLQLLFSLLLLLPAAAAAGAFVGAIGVLIMSLFKPVTMDAAVAMIFAGYMSGASVMAYRIWRN